MRFDGKNVLFISPEFFSVDQQIIKVLQELGANVVWFDERSVSSAFARAINSINPGLFNMHSNKYYSKIMDSIDFHVDIVLVIKGEMITAKIVEMMRSKWEGVEMILYLYDSMVNIRGLENKLHLYDRVLSFDPKDCEKYGLEFRPLFADFAGEKKTNTNYLYDLCFYGTMYGDRFRIINEVQKKCSESKRSFLTFCYLRGKFMLLYYQLTNKGFRRFEKRVLEFQSKSAEELSDMISKSNVVLDINDRNQNGLTMRTIETLQSSTKMITTNKDIVNYDFYNQNNICVIDRDNIVIPDAIFNNTYQTIDKNILIKYTAYGWVCDVFGTRGC